MTIKKLSILILLVTGLWYCKSPETNWTNLFDGKTLKGWKQLNGSAEFTVEEGCITGITQMNTHNSFLATEKQYTDFVLEYEMKMDEGLNSGVQIRSHSIPSYEDGRVHGLQVECDDSDRAWTGGLYDEARKGWRYPLEYNPPAKTAFKHQQWNKFRVLAIGHRIYTWVNGVSCSNLVEDEVETGFVALQVHAIYNPKDEGKKIQWKNIRIRPATEDDLTNLGKTDAPEVSFLINQLTDQEKQNGWKLLWDGKTSNGWRGAKLDHFPEKGWSMDHGELSVLQADGAESGPAGRSGKTRCCNSYPTVWPLRSKNRRTGTR